MSINSSTFKNLFSIVDQLPHYFVGSNAELNWPMSVIRLKSNNEQTILDIAEKILDGWRSYSNPSIDILSSSEKGIHNTITPIARKNQDGEYELYLVLRNNRTSEVFPDGIFHPHPNVQHIKKENIGLIEVMGLAILPPRLKTELNEVIAYLLGEINLSDVPAVHVEWAGIIKELYNNSNNKNIEKFMQEQIGDVFTQILEDAGVFKRSEKGQAAFKAFLNQFK